MKDTSTKYLWAKILIGIMILHQIGYAILLFTIIFTDDQSITGFWKYHQPYTNIIIFSSIWWLVSTILTLGIAYGILSMHKSKLFKETIYIDKPIKIRVRHIIRYTPELHDKYEKIQWGGYALLAMALITGLAGLYTGGIVLLPFSEANPLVYLFIIIISVYVLIYIAWFMVECVIKHALKNNLIPEERLAEIKAKIEADNQ
jgi:hypothetical protein